MSEKKQPLEEHLVQVLERLMKLQPEDPLKFFPLVSNSIRTGKFVPDKKTSEYAPKANLFTPLEKIKESLDEQKKFLDFKKPPPKKEKKADDAEAEPEPEPEENTGPSGLPDIISEFQTFQLGGISLSNEEIQSIVSSSKKILDQKPKKYTSLRFFGRIFGINQNYYIIECVPIVKEDSDADAGDGSDDPASQSKKPPKPVDPQGINKFKYLVSIGSPLSSAGWIELPDTTPELIQSARLIFNFFTGSLEAAVMSQPPFPGKERDYLRAQIERISCSTYVCPASIFKLENEEAADEDQDADPNAPKKKKPVKEVEAYKAIPSLVKNEKFDTQQNLLDLSNWVHVRPTILQSQGRCTYFDPNAKPEDEDDSNLSDEEKAKRPKKNIEMIWPILAPLNVERPVQKEFSEFGNWVARICQPSVSSNIVVLRSLTWPGAFSVGKMNQTRQTIDFSNVYLGNGQKSKKYAKIKIPDMQ